MVPPWCGQIRESATKDDAPVRTIASCTLPMLAMATPPTVLNVGKFFTSIVFPVDGSVGADTSPDAPHAASAAAAASSALWRMNPRRSTPTSLGVDGVVAHSGARVLPAEYRPRSSIEHLLMRRWSESTRPETSRSTG